ncbi:MAG TPA: DNA polymerase III subunit gamma/tau [Methylomirabilota bacterium]|nr:DNA polymerase III subunit gamma/tau [Methylomirabilota bacterium]
MRKADGLPGTRPARRVVQCRNRDMAYQVIARKYRPQRFADVVGQEHVTQTLTNAITQNRIAHAYLFCGPRGTGKTTIARIFAKCLNATGGPRVDFDDHDPRCIEIAEGRSLDVLEIDGASNNGVEQVRELRETCRFAPAASRFKIYIIDEVHMLSTAAFNALLKTLEEPPAHVKFMFATTDPEKVLATILSRCQRFDLRRIPVALIVQHLATIARQEGVQADEPALHAIARGSDGGMRDAESALDQLISFCGQRITEEDVLSMFGLTSRAQVLALADGILAADTAAVLRELDDLGRHGKDLGRLLADLLGHFRNLLIYVVSKGDTRLVEVSETELAALQRQAPGLNADVLTRLLDVLTESEARLRDAASKKIFVEVALLKAIQARNAISIDSILARLHELRAEIGSTPSASPGAVAPPASAPAPMPRARPPRPQAEPAAAPTVADPPAPATGTSTGDLEPLWRQLLEAVGRASPFTRSYLNEAFPVSLARNVFTIGFDPEFGDKLDLVNNAKTHAILQTKLAELGHPGVQIKFTRQESPGPRPAASVPAAEAPPPDAPLTPSRAPSTTIPATSKGTKTKTETPATTAEDFKNDPLIRQALEIFKGQIVEIRA